ncbi:SprT-like domain-containing protein [Fimbriimonas ginsengisoli]|uniref:Acidic repeat-containing protein n=1 Tax=Fimbriimonas ginsengisoli Gsoil 348 TaxID=661478 RepID=A0A068NQF1_FIMGI|nr:SprT-like domain-containing protein [Fimbriimonas ginsengisoli]AIE85572.1 Acidic repeat-containing protein [Fimbriimonas ginsengisoli Gsoil 348]
MASVTALREAAELALEEAVNLFPLPYVPILIWKGYRVTAGMAYYRSGAIGLSTRVLQTPEAVRETLLHEYAHLLAVHRHGKKAANHGEFWRQAMRDLGQAPQVRHSYEVERNVPRQQVTYVCIKCGKPFVRARRLPKRQRYIHRNCGGDLRLQSIQPIERKS